MSADEVEQRYHQVGGVPGNVFATELGFSAVLESQTDAIRALTKDQLQDIAQNGWNAVSNFSRMQPQSAIMGYERPGDDYAQRNVTPISKKVAEALFVQHKAVLWDEYSRFVTSNPAVAGWFFETMVICVLHGPVYSTTQKSSLGKGNKERSVVHMGGCSRFDVTSGSLIDAAFRTENVLYQSIEKNYPLIDFCYQKNDVLYAFQATCSDTHKAKASKIRKLANDVGGPKNLYLYYLVPSFYFDAFVTDPTDTVANIQKLIHRDIDEATNELKQITGREKRRKVNFKIRCLNEELEGPWNVNVAMLKDPRMTGNIHDNIANNHGEGDDTSTQQIVGESRSDEHSNREEIDGDGYTTVRRGSSKRKKKRK
jgi:hypothetical protein